MTAATSAPPKLNVRPAHRRVFQLFKTFGAQTDQEALQAAISEGWDVSPSGLRSRRAEITPPRGRGIRASGERRNNSTLWEIDPEVKVPERLR